MIETIDIESTVNCQISGSIDVFLNTQINVDAQMQLSIIKGHDQLDNLDYEHSGHTGFVSMLYFEGEIIKKVDKITGKGLSTEDFTTEDKSKLGDISDITQEEINNILAD
jgi:hypothetical protein